MDSTNAVWGVVFPSSSPEMPLFRFWQDCCSSVALLGGRSGPGSQQGNESGMLSPGVTVALEALAAGLVSEVSQRIPSHLCSLFQGWEHLLPPLESLVPPQLRFQITESQSGWGCRDLKSHPEPPLPWAGTPPNVQPGTVGGPATAAPGIPSQPPPNCHRNLPGFKLVHSNPKSWETPPFRSSGLCLFQPRIFTLWKSPSLP